MQVFFSCVRKIKCVLETSANFCTCTFGNARRAQCHFPLHNYQENRGTNKKLGGHKNEFYSSHKLQPSFTAN